jgi:hypothetical protein
MNEVIVKDIEAKMELMNNCLKLGQTMMKSYQHQKLAKPQSQLVETRRTDRTNLRFRVSQR